MKTLITAFMILASSSAFASAPISILCTQEQMQGSNLKIDVKLDALTQPLELSNRQPGLRYQGQSFSITSVTGQAGDPKIILLASGHGTSLRVTFVQKENGWSEATGDVLVEDANGNRQTLTGCFEGGAR